MLKIIIIDDASEKVAKYKELLAEFPEINFDFVDIAASLVDAEEKLSENQYDLAILDLFLPLRYGDDPNPDNAVTLLKDLSEDDDLKMPFNIVGITRMKDADPKYRESFEEQLLAYIIYEQEKDDWKNRLRQKIAFLIKAQRSIQVQNYYDYDVAVINALQSENKHVIRAFGEDGWQETKIPADLSTTYYTKVVTTSNGRTIRVVSCYALKMASTSSAVLTTKVIYNFRPKYLFMTGIAAAVDRQEANLGDIMIASKVWDGASGKIKTDEEGTDIFYPDFHEIPLDADINALALKLASNRPLLNSIEENYHGKKPEFKLNLRVGPIASVPAVLASEAEVKKLEVHVRKLLGVEMEGYGMFFSAYNSAHPRPKYTVLIKSVSDYADPKKSDDYQDYCMYTSASLAHHIIVNELQY